MDLLPNETVIWMWLIFAVVLVALNQWIFKPTLAILELRQKRMGGAHEDHSVVGQDTYQLARQYEEKMAQARLIASEAREELIQEAREKEKFIIDQARKHSEQVLHDMREEIADEKSKADTELENKAKGLANQMVSKIMEKAA